MDVIRQAAARLQAIENRDTAGVWISGKTGSGSIDDPESGIGWFVGFVESGGRP